MNNNPNVLEDFETPKKSIGRRTVVTLALYAPVAVLLFWLSSPLFVKISETDDWEENLPVGPLMLVFALLQLAVALILLYKWRSLSWKVTGWLMLAWIISLAGMLAVMYALTAPAAEIGKGL